MTDISELTATSDPTSRWGQAEREYAPGKIINPTIAPEKFVNGLGLSQETVLATCGLNWEVAKATISYATTTHQPWDTEKAFPVESTHPAPGRFMIHRTDKPEIHFAPVGKGYEIFQNAEVRDLAFLAVEQSETPLICKRAGTNGRNGERVFFELAFPTDLAFGGVEDIRGKGEAITASLYVQTTHNGGGALIVSTGYTRIKCTNGLTAALNYGAMRYSIRHTGSLDAKLAGVREALKIVPKVFAEFEDEVRKLIETEVTRRQAIDVVHALIPSNEGMTERQRDVALDNRAQLISTLDNDPRVGYLGTAWGLTQAVSTWDQHVRDVRGVKTLEARRERTLTAMLDSKSVAMERFANIAARFIPAMAA